MLLEMTMDEMLEVNGGGDPLEAALVTMAGAGAYAAAGAAGLAALPATLVAGGAAFVTVAVINDIKAGLNGEIDYDGGANSNVVSGRTRGIGIN